MNTNKNWLRQFTGKLKGLSHFPHFSFFLGFFCGILLGPKNAKKGTSLLLLLTFFFSFFENLFHDQNSPNLFTFIQKKKKMLMALTTHIPKISPAPPNIGRAYSLSLSL